MLLLIAPAATHNSPADCGKFFCRQRSLFPQRRHFRGPDVPIWSEETGFVHPHASHVSWQSPDNSPVTVRCSQPGQVNVRYMGGPKWTFGIDGWAEIPGQEPHLPRKRESPIYHTPTEFACVGSICIGSRSAAAASPMKTRIVAAYRTPVAD
jgi:hypothetical protein